MMEVMGGGVDLKGSSWDQGGNPNEYDLMIVTIPSRALKFKNMNVRGRQNFNGCEQYYIRPVCLYWNA